MITISAGSKWEIYVYRGNGTGISNQVRFNSEPWINAYTNSYDNSSGAALYGWVEVYNGGITTPSNIDCRQQSEAAYIAAIRVDDKIIIDAPGNSWNTGRIWSNEIAIDGTDNQAGGAPQNVFDGNLSYRME